MNGIIEIRILDNSVYEQAALKTLFFEPVLEQIEHGEHTLARLARPPLDLRLHPLDTVPLLPGARALHGLPSGINRPRYRANGRRRAESG